LSEGPAELLAASVQAVKIDELHIGSAFSDPQEV
jgi:hypothetical protein